MRLTQETIRQIITAHNEGCTHSAIARTHSIDVSTVRYHVEKVEATYGTTNVYSLVPPVRRACEHPSLKCLICGRAQDYIHRRELDTIRELKQKLERANKLLEAHGYSVE